MDIDFHFGTIYVLSRWAGFDGNDAKIIATCSQFVDDNISEDPLFLEDAVVPCDFGRGFRRLSGHDLWENLNEKGNHQVWIPYHFLPGMRGETEQEKLVCHKNSMLAQKMVETMIFNQNENRLFRLGITLHVYADTWAHQEFSGLTDESNIIYDIAVLQPPDSLRDRIEDRVIDVTAEVRPLGHASAIHWPDRPYVGWTSRNKFVDGRNNWDEFIEASKEIYAILQRFKGVASVSFTSEMEGLLLDTFQSIQREDCNQRNLDWINKIKANGFWFRDFSEVDKNVDYEKMTITDNPLLFYSALDEHYDFVKENLQNAGLGILE